MSGRRIGRGGSDEEGEIGRAVLLDTDGSDIQLGYGAVIESTKTRTECFR